MAVPLIVNVQPRTGPTGGRTLVEVTANNLRLPDPPPTTGKTDGILTQTVQVLFGSAPATDVRVISKGRLTCLAPANDQGNTDVTVTNLDNAGDPIAGETVTRTDIYLYSRPNLIAEADLTRLVRTLIRLCKQQIIDTVVLTQHTDFDADASDGLNITEIAKLPSLILVGPDVTESRFFSTNERRATDNGNGTFSIRRPSYTVNLEFEIIGVDDNKVRLLNLLATTIQWVNRNKFIAMDRDPDDLSLGQVKYELDFLEEGGEPKSTSRLSNSNIRSFAGKIVIRGFDIEDLAGVTEDMIIEKASEVVTIATQADELSALTLVLPIADSID